MDYRITLRHRLNSMSRVVKFRLNGLGFSLGDTQGIRIKIVKKFKVNMFYPLISYFLVLVTIRTFSFLNY